MRYLLTGLLATILLASALETASASESSFYDEVQGKWSGSGEIVAGKFKGTRFTCNFYGLSPEKLTGISIDGNCRIGMFSQPVKAHIERALAGYSGTFMDGAKGDGMDVVGGRYTSSRIAVDIQRNDLRGVLIAHLLAEDRLTVSVSVRVSDRLIPVIGMSLRRTGPAIDETVTSSVD